MGVIEAVGKDVPASRIGERVWLWNADWGRDHGTACECVALPERQAVPVPASVSDEAAACFGIPALTAMHSVITAGGVAGKSVLVGGGAGAVGHYAVQFAKQTGARQIIATVSSEAKATIAREAGATEVINYKSENVAERVMALTGGRGVDRIIEVDLAANVGTLIGALAQDGDWIVYGSSALEVTVPFFPLIMKGARLHFFIVFNLSKDARDAAVSAMHALFERGAVHHNIALRLPLSDIVKAHEMVEQGTVTGNIVLSVP
jgi:NADPH:quinone reductase